MLLAVPVHDTGTVWPLHPDAALEALLVLVIALSGAFRCRGTTLMQAEVSIVPLPLSSAPAQLQQLAQAPAQASQV